MSGSESAQKTYYHNLDLMKAIGICMVLCLHVPLFTLEYEQGIPFYTQYPFRLIAEGVPVFLVVNGFLLFSKTIPPLSKHYKKVLRLFLIFIGWAVFLAVAGSLIQGEPVTVRSVVNYVLAANVGAPYTGVLWFLQNLLAVYLIFPMLKLVYDHSMEMFKILFAIVSVFTVGCSVLILVKDGAATMGNAAPFDGILMFIDRFSPVGNGWYVFYFCLGGMVFHYKDRIEQRRMVWIILGIIAWIAATAAGLLLCRLTVSAYNPAFNYGSVFMPFILCGLYAVTLPFKSEGMVGSLISSLGRHTMGVYVTHFLFIWIIDRIMLTAGWISPYIAVVRIIRYALVLSGAWLLSVVIDRIPVLRKTVLM